jgi:F1F0 ATPase subunit 2
MRTIDLMTWLICGLGGAALGLLFFGGLWWTVLAIVASQRPALLQFASLTLRTAATLIGFCIVGGGDAGRLVACLAGFVVARAAVGRWVRTGSRPLQMPEAPHETRT